MDLHKLETLFQGNIILPNNADYDKARQLFYGGFDKKPAAIIKVTNAEEVKQALLFAEENHYTFTVRSGGHSVAGYSTVDDGIVIDLSSMRKVEVDKETKTVWAESGVTAGELTNELDKYNLVVGFGDTGSVGIGGITLGGGVGFLARKFGLAIDNLLAAEIVTVDGSILHVDETTHPDLFWALKGGGGNFGVVTKFQYKLHELSECYGGMLILPATSDVISGLVNINRSAPDELSAIINIMPLPPLPFIDKELYGTLVAMVLMVYAGDPKEGEQVVAPMRALAKPIADMVKPMRYKDIFQPEGEEYHPTAVSYNMFINDVDQTAATEALEWLSKIDSPVRVLQLRVLGGAVARVASDATAYAHRQNAIMCNVAAFYKDDSDKQEKQKWVHDFSNALYQGDTAAYVNFLGPYEQDRLLDAYPLHTLEKLREVKAKYDPKNQFCMNFNITLE